MTSCFITEDGISVPAVSQEQMIEIDRIAMEETGPNLFQMMENAGRNLAELILSNFSSEDRKEIIVLCGTGGNGGGGICAARHLVNRNIDAKLVLVNRDGLRGVPEFQLKTFLAAKGELISSADLADANPSLIIDALIGYSLKGAPRGITKELIDWCNDALCKIVSLDIPSGVDSNTGTAPGSYIRATHTLTLALPKNGLSPLTCGEIYLGDIGIPGIVYSKIGIEYQNPFGSGFIKKLRILS
ncbi:MAG: NAD(P)H-hydrate epimerase [Bacteroidetes bacterium]|nr:NAD(P)H-hydrate epimerase [Bacteroidota bacterium]